MPQVQQIGKKNTKVFTDYNGDIVVKLYETEAVRFNDYFITLDNGGWITATTANRMTQVSNQFKLGFSVSRKQDEMFVFYNGRLMKFDDTGKAMLKR